MVALPQFAHAWSGRAALALKVMNDAMDHLLEDGPHPGSPFVPSHRVKTSGLGLRSVAEASTSEVSVVVPTPSTAPVPSPDSIFQPKWTYTVVWCGVVRPLRHYWQNLRTSRAWTVVRLTRHGASYLKVCVQ